MRSFGVEEELLLVGARTGTPVPVSEALLDHGLQDTASPVTGPQGTRSRRRARPTDSGNSGNSGSADSGAVTGRLGSALTTEVQQEQLEAVSAPFTDLQELAAAIRAGRAEADRQAARLGARAVALGTSPLPALPHTVRHPRYLAMEDQYGLMLREQLTCGFHVHVSINSEDEAVAVLDRIRIWLPILIALASNSPFWQGHDSGYASFRYQVWKRWPSAGPTEIFGSPAAYHDLVRMLLESNVLLDRAMIYFDARLSDNYPTVEVRAPDVCMEADHAVALAAVVRALVETAARDWRNGQPPHPVPAEMLRLASWRASRSGLADDLIHPVENRPRPARACVAALLDHLRPVLAESGDRLPVELVVDHILRTGTGADRQRAARGRHGDLRHVTFDAVKRTNNPSTLL